MTEQRELEPHWAPVIHRHFRLQWEDVQDCFVLLYPEGMVKLNTSAGEILSRCDGNNTIDDIINTLSVQFPGVEGIGEDILAFFTEAYANQWLADE